MFGVLRRCARALEEILPRLISYAAALDVRPKLIALRACPRNSFHLRCRRQRSLPIEVPQAGLNIGQLVKMVAEDWTVKPNGYAGEQGRQYDIAFRAIEIRPALRSFD